MLTVLYMHLSILKYINHIIKCDIVLCSYFPCVMLTHVLYIYLQTEKKYIYMYEKVHLKYLMWTIHNKRS